MAACAPSAAQCTLTLTPPSIHLGLGASATGSFTVNASASNCSRPAKSNSTWIAVTFGQTGTGSGTVGYTVDASTLYTARTGIISVNNTVNFTVTQDAYPCTYSFTPVNQSVQPPGGNFTLGVGTTCTWTASTTTPWLAINAGGTTGNGTLSYTVAPNNSVASRTGSILINNQTYAVTQFGACCNYTVAPLTANYNATGGQGQISVQTDSACSWTVQNSASWIGNLNVGGVPVTSPSGNATLTYTVAVNVTPASATEGFTLDASTVVVGCSMCSASTPEVAGALFGSPL